jgi:hypothetical protein
MSEEFFSRPTRPFANKASRCQTAGICRAQIAISTWLAREKGIGYFIPKARWLAES